MHKTKPFKVGILGCGSMGLSVAQVLQKTAGMGDIMALDNRRERVAQLREEHGLRATADLAEVLEDPAVKLVFVTASNDAHKPLTLAALEAGKAVLCEKPIATTLADAEEMVTTAEQRGLFFQIGFELRYSKLYTQIKKWIDAGHLGRVVNTQCTYICSEFHRRGSWRNREASGGGMLGEKLCHYVDLPRWWIGDEVVQVDAIAAPNVVPYYEVHDNYHVIYKFANGAVSALTFMMHIGETFAGDPLRNVVDQQQDDGHQLTYLIAGTMGAAATDVFRRSIKRWAFSDSPTGLVSRKVEQLTWNGTEDGIYFHNGEDQTRDVVRRVQAGLPPATPARDALETMRVVFAAEQSVRLGRPVTLKELR